MTTLSRRRFLQGLGGTGLALLAGCVGPVPGPPTPSARRLGVLWGSSPNPTSEALMGAFYGRLRELGYLEGQSLLIEERRGEGDDQLAEPAAALVRGKAEVVLVHSAVAARQMREATGTIPIVSAGIGDLVGSRLAESLARPAGNVTGLSTPSLAPKLLQIFQETVPTLARLALLNDTTIAAVAPSSVSQFVAAGPGLGLEISPVGVARQEDLEPAIVGAARGRADGVIVSTGPLITANQARIAELLVSGRLPSMWVQSEAIARGGLISYGPNRASQYRRAADYVDRILRGAKPADLPVEQPTLFDFIVNLKTAGAIGLAVPPTVLAQATEVIR